MAKVYISLGTNLGDKVQNLNTAIRKIAKSCGTVEQKSSIYSSAPWGFESFNNFLNQVIIVKTELSPEKLIQNLMDIEVSLGRNRTENHYQDRIIDLDILFYGQLILNHSDLVIPHPKLHERNFILEPMKELSPKFMHPAQGKTIETLLSISSDSIKAYKYDQ